MKKFLLLIMITSLGLTKSFALLTDSIITQNQLREIAANAKTPAIQIAYLDKNAITTINYGEKEFGTGAKIGNNTIFQAASLSKVVATYAFLILVDKGLLDLDKPLWQYYQYERLKDDPYKELITAHMVLTHTTGLVNWEVNVGSKKWSTTPLKTRFKPGTDYRYSGEAYYYLQLVAEKITGKTLNELCSEYVFKPFGMEQSSFSYIDAYQKDIAIGHKEADSSFNKIGKLMNANSAYTLYTTASEYMKFIIEGVLKGKGLSTEMHKNFLTAKVSTAAKGKEKQRDNHVKCCFGIRTQENEEGLAYWHTGANGGGFRSVFIVYPKQQKALTMFMNANTGTKVMLPLFKKILGKNQTYWSIL